MNQQPESGPPVLKLYAIELPDGSIAMNGPYVLATENEGQAGRMADARDGQEIAFVRLSNDEFKNDPLPPHEAAARELQQAQDEAGTFNCPICGRGTPHQHTSEEVARHRGAIDRGDPISLEAYGQAFSDAVRGEIDFRFSGQMIGAIRARAVEIQCRINRSPPARELQQAQVVGPDFHQRFQCAANVMCATYRREVGKELLLSVAELLAYDALKAVDALTTPQSSAPVVGDEMTTLLREALEFTEYAAAALVGSHPLSDEYKAEFLELGDPLQKKLMAVLGESALTGRG